MHLKGYRGLALLLMVATIAPACSETPSPEFVVRRFYGAMQARSRPAMASVHDNLLSAATRRSLAEKASRLSESSGVRVEPWDVIVFRGLERGDRVSERTVDQVSETEARVTVAFEWYVPKVGDSTRPAPDSVVLPVVLEDGQWRVDLPDLAGPGGS